jgi:shikimate 5-dehydrogenase
MNVGQAARAFKLFAGIEPDAERMDRHFRSLQREKEGAPT